VLSIFKAIITVLKNKIDSSDNKDVLEAKGEKNKTVFNFKPILCVHFLTKMKSCVLQVFFSILKKPSFFIHLVIILGEVLQIINVLNIRL